jgi:hypothetical protein
MIQSWSIHTYQDSKRKKPYHNSQSFTMEVKNSTKLKQNLIEALNGSTVPVTKDMQFYLFTVAI